jgi:PKD repeat protein
VLDTHTATWSWGDGTSSAGRVVEHKGIGATHAQHRYARAGTYTVTVTVRDDDGGSDSQTSRIKVR